MKKLFLLQLLMFITNIAFNASVIPILEIDNTHPIVNCNYVHCILKIENPSVTDQELVLDFKHDRLKVENSTLPNRFIIQGGENKEYVFDILVEKSENPLDSVSMMINLQRLDEPSIVSVKKMLYPMLLDGFDPTKINQLSPCKKNISQLDREANLNSDVIIQNSMTVLASPFSKFYLFENNKNKEQLQKISVIGCQENWDGLILSKEVSNNELDKDNIEYQIFPNPTSNLLYIKSNTNENVEITLLSSDGKTLNSYNRELNSPIDIKELPEGSYFIKIKSSQNKSTFKSFIKIN